MRASVILLDPTEREREREREKERKGKVEKEECGKKRKYERNRMCRLYCEKCWILVERKIRGKSIGAYDSNLFFNFAASILQILKFPKNLYVSRFLFSTQQFSFLSIHPLLHRRKFPRHATYCCYEPRQLGRVAITLRSR